MYDNLIGLVVGFDKFCEVLKVLEYFGFGVLELGGIIFKF